MIRTFDFILKAKYNKAFMEQLEKAMSSDQSSELCTDIAEDHTAVLLAKQAADNLQLPFELTKTGGCSDGNFLCGYGLPCVLLATGMNKVHTTEECLRECDLYDCARWVTEIIRITGEK